MFIVIFNLTESVKTTEDNLCSKQISKQTLKEEKHS